MTELPSYGRCFAAFLLAHSARLGAPTTADVWISSAHGRSTFLAAACDIPGTAQILLAGGLAKVEGVLVLDDRLTRFSHLADRDSLVAIAKVFLARFPPRWMSAAVIEGQFVTEFVPEGDLRALAWLGSDLEAVILEAHHAVVSTTNDALRKQIGEAAELAIMSALEELGHRPRRVSLISDVFGYDIEYQNNVGVHRLEVKGSVDTTAGRVVVSRNEFDKAGVFGSSWKLVQVVFSSSIVVKREACAVDVHHIRELSSDVLLSLSPPPGNGFRWIEAAEFRPAETSWKRSTLCVGDNFSVRFSELDHG